MRATTVRMADFTIGIAYRNRAIGRMLLPYRARGAQEFRAHATDGAIRAIIQRSAWGTPLPWEAESLALFEAICEQLPERGAFMVHAACLAVDGAAYAFLAPSGTGKTTHMLNWIRLLGTERAVVINGDKPFLRSREDGFFAYGNPWARKENLHTPMRARLNALCFLERGTAEEIRPLAAREALPHLVQQVYLPRAADGIDRTLPLIERIARCVPAYLLRCTASPDAARLAIKTMLGEGALDAPNRSPLRAQVT